MSVPGTPRGESLPAFRNEPYTDFTVEAHRAGMLDALARVRGEFGREYKLWIGGQGCKTEAKLSSLNPSHPDEVAGVHQMATAELAAKAIESVSEFYPEWRRVNVELRVHMLLRVARILRQRKLEFDAWLVHEAGKTWPEAEADVSEAVDFCEYYARQMLRYASGPALVQLPGERDQMRYLPLGAGVILPPWNFPLAILVGMTTAALVAGNAVVIKPSSDTPTIAAKFVEVLMEAGFPDRSFAFVTGSGAVMGDALVEHPLTRFVSFTGSRDVGLRINELAARPRQRQRWIKRVIAEMGGKDAIIVDDPADLDRAVAGVSASAFGYQGQKCSACSRLILDEKIHDEFLDRLRAKVETLRVGPSEDPDNYMGPVINSRAMRSILEYIAIGRQQGRLVAGGKRAPGDGYFIQPTIIAGVDPKARVFQEEIFGPVLAVTRARDFDHALELANDTDYGLTGAVFSRDGAKIEKAREAFFVGNLYINRKCTGAMVGAHPFGGFNMSGTDSKAGGPDYLLQFLQAQSVAEGV
jgi:1-pyrroline-5-carboxylate dehydrogenase